MESPSVAVSQHEERERARADFLEAAVRNYAPHVWNDIKQILERDYPRGAVTAHE